MSHLLETQLTVLFGKRSHVPVHGSEPGQFFLFTGDSSQEDDLLVDETLNHDDQQNDKQWSCGKTGKEASNHDQRPQCSSRPVSPLCLGRLVSQQHDRLSSRERCNIQVLVSLGRKKKKEKKVRCLLFGDRWKKVTEIFPNEFFYLLLPAHIEMDINISG